MAKKLRTSGARLNPEKQAPDRVGTLTIEIVDLMPHLFYHAELARERGEEFRDRDPSHTTALMNLVPGLLAKLATLLTEAVPLERKRIECSPYTTDHGTQLRFDWPASSRSEYQPGDFTAGRRQPLQPLVSAKAWAMIAKSLEKEEARAVAPAAAPWLHSARGAVITYAADFWYECRCWGALLGETSDGFSDWPLDLPAGQRLVVDYDRFANPDCWIGWGRYFADFPRLLNETAVKEWIAREKSEIEDSARNASRDPGQNGSANRRGPGIPSICRQEQALRTISDALATIQNACKNRAQAGLLDLHRSIQRFFCRFLNEAFGLNLVELDNIQPNFPAIDLGDKDAQRCFQITSDKSSAKVQATLDTYVKKRLFEQYGAITILIIGDRQRKYNGLRVPDAIRFDTGKGILGIPELIKHVKTLETQLLERLASIIDAELRIADPAETVQ